jgi:WD40 repeat protein/tetratricopeptide (TPR) repeat protein
MSEMINPYIAGAPVTEKSMFFGRQDVFDWVQRSLTGKFVDHILVIHGQRRVGKTSVLKQIPFHLPSTYIPVFFDLQGRTHTSLDRFLWRLAKEISRTLRTAENISLAVPDREDFARDPELFQNQFLPQLEQTIGDRRLLLIFDEFDSLEEPTARQMLAQDLIPYLSRLMHAPSPLAFIFCIGSSGRKLEHMQASYTDFFRIALYRKISFLGKEEALGLITQPVAGVIEYTPQAVEDIFHITSGHPYFTQLLCHELFGYCQKSGQRRIAPEEIEAVLDDVVERGTVNLKFVWDDASDPERYVLTALSMADDGRDAKSIHQVLQSQKVRISQREVADSLRHLQEKDVLAPDSSFTVDLMRLWLLENKPLDRVIEELTEVSPIVARFIEIAQEFHETGVREEALNNYRRALEIDPQNLAAQVGIASLIFEQGDLPQALQEYERAMDIDPEDIVARSGLCQTHLALGDQLREKRQIEGALEHYRQILSINEQHLEAQERLVAYEELANMYRQTKSALSEKRYDQAVRLLKEIVARDVSYRDATKLLAQAVELQRGAKPLWKDIRVLGGIGGVIVVITAILLFRLLPGFIQAPAPLEEPTPTPEATATAAPFAPTPTSAFIFPTRILYGHGSTWVETVAFSPDGQTLASGAQDKMVVLWDVESGEQLRTLEHTENLHSLAFSPDGEILATGSIWSNVKLWRVSDGTLLQTLEFDERDLTSVAFSPDGQTLATSRGPDGLQLWRFSDGALLRTLEDACCAVAFSPDGTTIVAGLWRESGGPAAGLWRVSDGTLLHTVQGDSEEMSSVAFSPDGETLASGWGRGPIRLWSVSDGTLLHTFSHTGDFVASVDFSPDGETLAAELGNGTIGLWSVSDGTLLRILGQAAGSPVMCVAYSPDGQTLASGGPNGGVKLWDVAAATAGPEPTPSVPTPAPTTTPTVRTVTAWTFDSFGANEVLALAFSSDGRTLASSARTGVKLWDIESDNLLTFLEFGDYTQSAQLPSCVAFSSDGQILAAGGPDYLRVWRVADEALLYEVVGLTQPVQSVALPPDGAILASGAYDGRAMLWDVDGGEQLRTLEGERGFVHSVALSPDGAILASVLDSSVILWDVQTGRQLHTLEGHTEPVRSVAFSPNGKTLASGAEDTMVILWDVESGQQLRTLEGHTGEVRSVAFSPDGANLASGASDQTVILWDVESGQQLRTLEEHTSTVGSLAFSPDGATLASGSWDATVILWDVGQL